MLSQMWDREEALCYRVYTDKSLRSPAHRVTVANWLPLSLDHWGAVCPKRPPSPPWPLPSWEVDQRSRGLWELFESPKFCGNLRDPVQKS